jgi:hypothetical protein
MRTLLFLFLVGCAHDKPHQIRPAPEPTEEEKVQLRACESCRSDLQSCKRRSGLGATDLAECMNQFMKCVELQQLDTARCAGLN